MFSKIDDLYRDKKFGEVTVSCLELRRKLKLSEFPEEILYKCGIALLKLEKYDVATTFLKEVLSSKGSYHYLALYNLGRIYVRLEQYEKGLELLYQSEKGLEYKEDLQLYIGAALVGTGQCNEGIKKIKEYLKLKDNPEASYFLAKAIIECNINNPSEIAIALSNLLKWNRHNTSSRRLAEVKYMQGLILKKVGLYRASISALIEAGDTYQKINEYAKAIIPYEEAKKIIPGFAPIYYKLANAYKRLNKYQQAYDIYSIAIQLNPKYPETYVERGMVAKELFKNPEMAIKDFEIAIDIITSKHKEAKYTRVFYEATKLYLEVGNYVKALETINVVINNNCDFSLSELFFTRANIYLNLKRYQSAVDDLERALQANHSQKENILLLMAKIYLSIGQISKAETKLIELDKYGHPKGYYTLLAEINVGQGNINKAIELCKKGIMNNEETAAIILAQLLVDDDPNYVITTLSQFSSLLKASYNYYYYYAKALFNLDRYSDALPYLNEAIKLSPESPEAYDLRAQIYISMGQTHLADLDFDRAKAFRTVVEQSSISQ